MANVDQAVLTIHSKITCFCHDRKPSGIPINFSPDVAANPALWLVVRADGASLFRRGMVLDLLGMILSVEALALRAVASYVLFSPIWAVWLGIDLVPKPVQIA